MGLDIARLASVTGLEVSTKKHEIYGDKSGYRIYIRYFSNDLTLMLRVYAAGGVPAFRSELNTFSQAHKGLTFARAWDNRVTAMLTIDKSDNEEAAAAEIDAFVGFIAAHGLMPCCSMCGGNKPTRLYEMTIDNANLCDECAGVLTNDISKANGLFALQRPNMLRALFACLIAGVLTFIYSHYTSGDVPEVWGGMIGSSVGVILSVFFVKKLVGKSSIAVALMSVIICILAAMLGTVSWFCSFFADFNRDNAEGQQYIIDYCEKVNEGFDPYAEAYHSGNIELAGKYASLDGVSDKKLDEYYKGAKRIVDHRSYTECFKDFRALMFTSYGDKVRNGFYRLLVGDIAGAVLIGIILWRRVLGMDKFKYKLTPLPRGTVNPYDMIVGNNQRR